MMSTLYINNQHIDDFHAHLLQGYTIGGTALENETFHGRNRTSFNLLAQARGLKEIGFELEFEGTTRHEVELYKSTVDAMLLGQVDLYFPDGFHYDTVISSLGDMELEGVDGRYVVGKASYKGSGIRHGEMVTHNGNRLFCESTAPHTDCILECTLSKAYDSFTLGTVTYTGVKKGQKLRVNGIDGRILIDDAPAAGNFTFTGFPYLTAGWNNIDCNETVTVTYYPTYI